MTISELTHTLQVCFNLQMETTALWHKEPPQIEEPKPDDIPTTSKFKQLVVAQHLRNFKIWHEEDKARRLDVDASFIAECKRCIDKLNQQRNDLMEQIDICFLELIQPLLPNNINATLNTESIGMAIDRSSILSLKIWHMNEQLERKEVSHEHITNCKQKVEVLKVQRYDLNNAIIALVREFHQGTRVPKLYFQFKMYNDPTLNPELY